MILTYSALNVNIAIFIYFISKFLQVVLLLLLESSIRAFSLDLKYSRNLNLESSVNDVLEFYGAFFVIFECVRVHFISPSIFEQKLYEGDSFVIVFFFSLPSMVPEILDNC